MKRKKFRSDVQVAFRCNLGNVRSKWTSGTRSLRGESDRRSRKTKGKAGYPYPSSTQGETTFSRRRDERRRLQSSARRPLENQVLCGLEKVDPRKGTVYFRCCQRIPHRRWN